MSRILIEHGFINQRRFGIGDPHLIALHGFTQHGGAFAELAALLDLTVTAPDLPGHGRTEVSPVTAGVAIDAVSAVIESIGPPVALLGYSQGGRLALQLALTRPELVSRLVLISTSPGISGTQQREERKKRDEALAGYVLSAGIDAFIDEWLALPMFAGLLRRQADWIRSDRRLRLENTAEGLAAALRGMGQGVQRYFGDELAGLGMPALFVAGADDPDYLDHATAMASAVPNGALSVVNGAGHSLVGEAPEAVSVAVRGFVGARR